MADKKVTRQLSIFINDREVVNSLGGINREIAKVNGQMRNLNKSSDTYDQDLSKLKNTLGELKDRQSDFKEEIYDTNKAGQQASEVFSNIFVGLRTGNLAMVKEGMQGVKGAIVGATRAGLAFIATPIGATIALIAGAFASAKAIFDYNRGLEQANEKLRSLGVEAQNLSVVRSEIEATAETFNKEFNDIAEKVNSFSKTYGISMSEANEVIRQGLADGGAQNDEFLDSLGEYDEFFASAGFSATEFINILNTGFELGIYTDKLPDALKEADLSLREQTKTTRDALVNAFGASFTDDILQRVSSGETTTKQALEEIAAQAEKTGLSQQQQAQLTADVFKGAGEDAGGALKILEAVGQSATRELDSTAQAQLKLAEANEKLNKAQAELFEVEGFSDIWLNIQTVAVDALASVLEYLGELKQDLQPLIDIVGVLFVGVWEQLKFVVSGVFGVIGGILKGFGSLIGGLFKAIKQLIEGDFLGAFITLQTGISNAFKNVANAFISLYNNALELADKMIDAISPVLETLGVDVDKLKERLESFKGVEFEIKRTETNETNNTTTEDTPTNTTVNTKSQETIEREKKEALERQKIRDAAAKEELSKRKALEAAKIQLAEAELELFIANAKTKIDENGLLTQELIAQEVERLQSIKDKQQQFNDEELARKLVEAEANAKTEEEFLALKEALNIEYNLKKQELDLAFQQETDVLKKEYETQQAALEAEQLLFQKELDLEAAENEFEEQRIRTEQQYETELADLKKRLQDGFITEQQFAIASENLEKQKAANLEAIDKAEKQARLAAYGDLFGNIAQLLGENTAAGKAAAIAEIGISQGLAVARVWSAKDTLPSPFNIIAKVAQTALAIGNVLSALKQVSSVKTPKFFFGGPTGKDAALGYDQYGPITGHVHKNEWVAPEIMTQNPVYADTIGWLESERKRIIGKPFVEGGETTPNTLPPNVNAQASPETTNMLMGVLTQLNTILSSGIIAKAVIGYQEAEAIDDLNNERQQSNNNGTLS